MESFGAYLRSLREEQGKTLEEIAENTKIAVANLDLLERDRYELLPPRVFVRGFIRSYVQELGVSPEESLRRFEEFTKEGELPDYGGQDPAVFARRENCFFIYSWILVYHYSNCCRIDIFGNSPAHGRDTILFRGQFG